MGKKNQNKRKRSLSSDEKDPDNGGQTSKKPKAATTVEKVPNKVENPLLQQQAQFMNQNGLTEQERHEFFSPEISSDRRAELWMAQADLGEDLVNRYAWATPDDTAIRILKEFSPLIEIGCGSNAYWCHILKQNGIDIIGYDVNIASGGKIGRNSKKKNDKESKSNEAPSSFLKQGGPDVLATKEIQQSGRTLFLCYPDEEEESLPSQQEDEEEDDSPAMPSSLGWQCLQYYSGEYIVHVGETFLDANLSVDQAPWGRSSSPEFQQLLASEYHCLLKVGLPNWFHTRDSISVWKRSTISTIVFAADDDDDDDTSEQEDEEVEYRHIPRDERLPINLAAPCLAHLLPGRSHGSNKGKVAQSPKSTTPLSKVKTNAPLKSPASSGSNKKEDTPKNKEMTPSGGHSKKKKKAKNN